MQLLRSRSRCGGGGMLTSIWGGFAIVLHSAGAVASTAISVPIDGTRWIGYDGTWSPLTVSIGTPPQAVDLFPSTTGQETLVVGLNGCAGSSICQTLRGGLFAANESSSFRSDGDYDLGLDTPLGLSGAGYYGLDTITIGNQGSVDKQVIAVVNSTQYWTGSMGLGTANTTLGMGKATSLLDSLTIGTQPKIPSLSYGLTMGASYRLKQVPSSLTLGGYDANRFIPNGATFTLNENQKPSVALNSFSVAGFGANNNNVSLLGTSDQALYTIDSNTPFLWLPEPVATKLGQTLGLIYNDTLDTFVYPNVTQYNALKASNLSFSFGFSELPNTPIALSLGIDGQAFTSLNLSFGFPGLVESSNAAPIPYFPVRKAANSTQYTIGRSFLQETYLIVDYGRNNFSISQAKFSLDANINLDIQNILPASDTNGSPVTNTNNGAATGASSSISPGAIAGIAVAIAVVLVIVVCGVAIFFIRRHYAKKVTTTRAEDLRLEPRHGISRLVFGDYRVAELAAREFVPTPLPPQEKGVEAGDDHLLPGYYAAEKNAFGDQNSYPRGKHIPLTSTHPALRELAEMEEQQYARELPASTPSMDSLRPELPGSSIQLVASSLSPAQRVQQMQRNMTPLSPSALPRPEAPVELPTRQSDLSDMYHFYDDSSLRNRSHPSPSSSIGGLGTVLTVSAIDSASEGGTSRSPGSPTSGPSSRGPDSPTRALLSPNMAERGYAEGTWSRRDQNRYDSTRGRSKNQRRPSSKGGALAVGGVSFPLPGARSGSRTPEPAPGARTPTRPGGGGGGLAALSAAAARADGDEPRRSHSSSGPAGASMATAEPATPEPTYAVDEQMRVNLDPRQLRNAPRAGKMRRPSTDDLGA